ncbi:MAG: nuclease-related domain-containing protein [Capsulimonadales bacterium]|nr:nuclease-related domain-containing protein [Capsulimonadales bacterium]
MIVKELDTFTSTDSLARAGRKAEEDLSFYLRRAFADSPDLRVFNGLRLERDGDAAQVDHLILHRFGLLIIESKSVASRIRVNEQEEWSRFWNASWQGMPSPIRQAERQGAFLRQYLQAHREVLRNKALFGMVQKGFVSMNIDVLVSISDSGIIDRPKKLPLPQVVKADQITDQVHATFQRHRKADSLFNPNVTEGGWSLSQDEIERVSTFLLREHRPLRQGPQKESFESVTEPSPPASTPAVPFTPPDEPVPVLTCRHCQSSQVVILFGKFGYYAKCQVCEGNTQIRRLCTVCEQPEKIRKQGDQFFAACANCGTERPFFTNPVRTDTLRKAS